MSLNLKPSGESKNHSTQSSCKDDHLSCSIFEATLYARIWSSSPTMDQKPFLCCSSSTFCQIRNLQNPRSDDTTTVYCDSQSGGKILLSIFKIRTFVGFFLALISIAVYRVYLFLTWGLKMENKEKEREELENYQRSHEAFAEPKMYQMQQLGKLNSNFLIRFFFFFGLLNMCFSFI